MFKLDDETVYSGIKLVTDQVAEHCDDDVDTLKLEMGVGRRLRGAYACYKADMQLECLRHILLALGTLCDLLGWDKASFYINGQNPALYEMSKSEREAA